MKKKIGRGGARPWSNDSIKCSNKYMIFFVVAINTTLHPVGTSVNSFCFEGGGGSQLYNALVDPRGGSEETVFKFDMIKKC